MPIPSSNKGNKRGQEGKEDRRSSRMFGISEVMLSKRGESRSVGVAVGI